MSKIELPPLPPAHRRLGQVMQHVSFGIDGVKVIETVDNSYQVFTADQLRAYAEQIVEVCAARIGQLRDEHCAATQQAEDRSDHCHADGSDGCEFVAAWNDAIAAIRNLIEESNNG
jgi:hypothetical protein